MNDISGTVTQPLVGGAPWAFLGRSGAAERVREKILRAARTDATVLITGESGVGKELVAREIHGRGSRRTFPFIAVNCAAIPDSLVESELFGHENGAFTDARFQRRGAFEMADRGTLFLDEVGDLSPQAQPKLLRAIESGEILRVGAETPRRVDLRIVAATNHDLQAMGHAGAFRSDLYFRLRILQIRVPPLRQRIEDVPELAHHFAETIARVSRRDFRGLTSPAIELLQSHPWPGNIRELRSVIEQAMVLSSGAYLDVQDIELEPISSSEIRLDQLLERDWRTAKEQFETAYAKRLLHRHRERVAVAARAAGLSSRALYKILHRLGLRPEAH